LSIEEIKDSDKILDKKPLSFYMVLEEAET
jgi:hypothetical protein